MLHFLSYTAIKQTNKTNEQSFIYVTFYFRILEMGLEHVQTFGLGYKIVRSH